MKNTSFTPTYHTPECAIQNASSIRNYSTKSLLGGNKNTSFVVNPVEQLQEENLLSLADRKYRIDDESDDD